MVGSQELKTVSSAPLQDFLLEWFGLSQGVLLCLITDRMLIYTCVPICHQHSIVVCMYMNLCLYSRKTHIGMRGTHSLGENLTYYFCV